MGNKLGCKYSAYWCISYERIVMMTVHTCHQNLPTIQVVIVPISKGKTEKID